ncbi:NUDIX domain-containing protein [Thermosipho atlanticus]|uniref:8-oxo-dGTP diphosphatase n=1 Tax=Thermosipho atlanticus DSM 15807 TaxID=1123380 RepID=A0A1M5R2Z6_9BACT|nr:NUDIX domain-containing protein [Thermosipho atlanticus]SHH20744.1 8-oxo-dGTP diphosphatase [Thermosipho atlanticus DSM 15807]
MDFVEKIRRSKIQKVAVMCYAENEYDEVLMLERSNEPFKNKLVPPGGKVKDGEKISEALKREFFEETGIILKNYVLKVITTELGPEHYNWILFIYKAFIKKQPTIKCSEGKLYWIRKSELKFHNISDIDKKILPYIFYKKGLYLMKINYDELKNAEIISIRKLSSVFK